MHKMHGDQRKRMLTVVYPVDEPCNVASLVGQMTRLLDGGPVKSRVIMLSSQTYLLMMFRSLMCLSASTMNLSKKFHTIISA